MTIMTQETHIFPTLSEEKALFNFQKRSVNHFRKVGFPTTKHENWLYWTPSEDVQSYLLNPLSEKERAVSTGKHIDISNGRLTSSISTSGVIVTTDIASYMECHPLTNHVETSPISLLANCFFNDIVVVDVQTDQSAPIQINITNNLNEKGSINTRILCVVRQGVNVNFVLNHKNEQSKETVSNTYFELLCQDAANTNISHVFNSNQNDNFFSSSIHMNQDARCVHVTYTKDAEIMRHDTEVNFRGESADLELKGLSILSGTEQFFNHLKVNHHVGASHCSQHFKTILTDQSVSEFSGLVFVEKGAHETDSTQLNQNLLFSDAARVLSRPQLRIDADDVQCNHGSTIGQLNPEEVHYIKSRGLNEEAARKLLIYGFAEEIIETIHDDFTRQFLKKEVKATIESINYG